MKTTPSFNTRDYENTKFAQIIAIIIIVEVFKSKKVKNNLSASTEKV